MRSGISCFTLVERGPTGQCVTFSSRRLRASLQTPHPALLTLQDRAPIIFRSYRLRIIKEGRWRCPVCRTVGGLFGNSHLASRLVRAGPRRAPRNPPDETRTVPDARPAAPPPRAESAEQCTVPRGWCRGSGADYRNSRTISGAPSGGLPRARAHSRDTLPKMCCTFTRTGHLSQPGPERASLASP